MIRLKTLFATLFALAAVLALPASGAAVPGPACVNNGSPPSDINTYLVLAKTHFETKGGNNANTGKFLGGNVGVSNDNGTLRVGQNGRFSMSANTALVGDDSVVGDDIVNVWDVFTNTTSDAITDSNVTWHNSPKPYCIPGFPVVNNFPDDPGFAPGNTNINVNGVESPVPGPYGDVTVGAGDTLNLDTGTYNLKSLKVSDGGVVNTEPGTIVNIDEDLSAEGTLGSSPVTRWFVRGTGVDVNSNVVNFSVGGSTVFGTFIVPNGEIALGHGTVITGRVWGNSMHSDFNINMTFAKPDCTTNPELPECNPPNCTTNPELPECKPPPCVPTAGQDENCQPGTTTQGCVPKAGQDKNCKPLPTTTDSAKVTGVKGGCSTTSNVRVSGSNIKKVTYKIDGKTVKTVKKAPYTYKLKTKDYKVGAHKLKVTTTFKSGKTKTQTLTFQHCKKTQPRFTG